MRLDDVELGRISDLNAGEFRAEVMSALQNLRAGWLRDWQGQLGDTVANRLAGSFGRSPSRWGPDPNNDQDFSLFASGFSALCVQVGAQPWIVVPTTLINSEYTALGSYLAQAQSIYGFREIVVEWGNENWNSVFRAAGIQDPVVMAQAANTGFALIRQAAGPLTPLHMVVNGQFVNPWIGQQAILHAPQADGVDVAPYYFYTLDNGTAQSTAIAQMLNDSDESPLIAQLAATTQPLNKSIGVYEVNASTTQGSAPQAQRDPLVAGEISGTALAARLLTGINTGVKRQLVWNLAQFDLGTANGVTALYGIAHDLTASSNFRPTGLAVEMLNTAISGDLYPVTVTGADGLTAAAFLSSAGWAMAITSSSPAAITVGITRPLLDPTVADHAALGAPSHFDQRSRPAGYDQRGLPREQSPGRHPALWSCDPAAARQPSIRRLAPAGRRGGPWALARFCDSLQGRAFASQSLKWAGNTLSAIMFGETIDKNAGGGGLLTLR